MFYLFIFLSICLLLLFQKKLLWKRGFFELLQGFLLWRKK